MNNIVPDGERLIDFQRAIGTPDYDIGKLPLDVQRYIIFLEVKLYSLWIDGKVSIPKTEDDSEVIPF